MSRDIAPEIPARTGVAIERIGLAGHFFAINSDFEPIFAFCQSRTTRVVWFVIFNFRNDDRQLIFWNGVWVAIFIVGDWNWTAPIALARNEPVAHLIGNLWFTNSPLFEPSSNLLTRIFAPGIVELSGVHQDAFAVVAFAVVVGAFWFFNYFSNWQIKLFGKLKIALIVSRHTHHGTFAVARKHVIGHPNRHFLAVKWINGIRTSKDTGFFVIFLAFYFGFLDSVFAVFFNFFFSAVGNNFRNQRMLWSQREEAHAKNRINTSGEDFDFGFGILHVKVYQSAFRTANPVLLHGLDFFWPIQSVNFVEQFISIGSNLKEPLFHFAFFNFVTTAPAAAVLDLLVG